MKNSALVVIGLQNDITKHYREIIENVNAAISWAIQKTATRTFWLLDVYFYYKP